MADLSNTTVAQLDALLKRLGVDCVVLRGHRGEWVCTLFLDNEHVYTARAKQPASALACVVEYAAENPPKGKAWTLEEVLAEKRRVQRHEVADELDAVMRQQLAEEP